MAGAGDTALLPDEIKAQSPSARLVYIALFWFGWLTKAELAEMTGYSRRGIDEALKELRAAGYLDRRWSRRDTRVREYRLTFDEE